MPPAPLRSPIHAILALIATAAIAGCARRNDDTFFRELRAANDVPFDPRFRFARIEVPAVPLRYACGPSAQNAPPANPVRRVDDPDVSGVGPVDTTWFVLLARSRSADVRSCYLDELRERPSARGRLDVRSRVAAPGRIESVSFQGFERATRFRTCVAEVFCAMPVRALASGVVDFVFAFEFSPFNAP
jgi:hypothetical protein